MEIGQVFYKQPDKGYSDAPLKVNNVGYYKGIGRNIHITNEVYDDYLIIYNLIGETEVWFNYDCQRTYSGDITIIPPGVWHKFSYFYKEDTKYYWCHFSGEKASEIAEKLIAERGRVFHIGCYKNIAQLFLKIYESMLNKSEEASNNILFTLLYSIGALSDKSVSGDEDVTDVLKSIIYIHNNFNKDITVDELCKMSNVSKFNFMRKFKAATGSPVHKYIIDYRMMQAKKLLAASDLNIKEISTQVGFTDNMYFSRAFKKHCGMSPTEYKASL